MRLSIRCRIDHGKAASSLRAPDSISIRYVGESELAPDLLVGDGDFGGVLEPSFGVFDVDPVFFLPNEPLQKLDIVDRLVHHNWILLQGRV